MVYEDSGFCFELPKDWRKDTHIIPTTFFGPNGGMGLKSELIQLKVGGILPEYSSADDREKFLAEPGVSVARGQIGDEGNVVILTRESNSEISIVRDGIHYSFSHANDPTTISAITLLGKTAKFPTRSTALANLREWANPTKQALEKALRANSPEEARATLNAAGVPSVRIGAGTFHKLESSQAEAPIPAKKWWQFWKFI